jgi:nucleotide-binding universal stress UspA family protein
MVNMGLSRILIAVDESPIAAHAAEIGIAMANCLKSEIAFMYVIDSQSVRAGEGLSSNDALKMAELAAFLRGL